MGIIQHVLYRNVHRSERSKHFIGPRQPEMVVVLKVGPPTRAEHEQHQKALQGLMDILVDAVLRQHRKDLTGALEPESREPRGRVSRRR